MRRTAKTLAAQDLDTPITQKEFKDFVCTRGYDIISENRYRKYLVQSREGSDAWAIEVQV